MTKLFNNSIISFALFAFALVAGCGGSIHTDIRTDQGSMSSNFAHTSVDTRGSTDFCLERIRGQRDSELTAYCQRTGGCSGEGAVTEEEVTLRLSMSDLCTADPSRAVCQDFRDVPADQLPIIESTTRTRRTEAATRTTGLDSGMAFFAAGQTARIDAMFCQNAARQFGSGMSNLPTAFWQAGAMGMPFGMTTGMPFMNGFGGMGGGGFGNGAFGVAGPRGQMRYSINYLLPQDIIVTVTVMSEQGEMLSQRPSQGSGIMNDPILMTRPLQGNTAVFQWQCSNGRTGTRTRRLDSDFPVTPDLCGLPAGSYMTASY